MRGIVRRAAADTVDGAGAGAAAFGSETGVGCPVAEAMGEGEGDGDGFAEAVVRTLAEVDSTFSGVRLITAAVMASKTRTQTDAVIRRPQPQQVQSPSSSRQAVTSLAVQRHLGAGRGASRRVSSNVGWRVRPLLFMVALLGSRDGEIH